MLIRKEVSPKRKIREMGDGEIFPQKSTMVILNTVLKYGESPLVMMTSTLNEDDDDEDDEEALPLDVLLLYVLRGLLVVHGGERGEDLGHLLSPPLPGIMVLCHVIILPCHRALVCHHVGDIRQTKPR